MIPTVPFIQESREETQGCRVLINMPVKQQGESTGGLWGLTSLGGMAYTTHKHINTHTFSAWAHKNIRSVLQSSPTVIRNFFLFFCADMLDNLVTALLCQSFDMFVGCPPDKSSVPAALHQGVFDYISPSSAFSITFTRSVVLQNTFHTTIKY